MDSTLSETITWKTSRLRPLWVLQIILFILAIIFLSFAVSAKDVYTPARGIAIGVFAYSIVSLVLVMMEIITFASGTLKAGVYLGSQLFKSVLWSIVLVISCIGLSRVGQYSTSTGSDGGIAVSDGASNAFSGSVIFVSIYLAVASIVLYSALAYSCVRLHRSRKARINVVMTSVV